MEFSVVKIEPCVWVEDEYGKWDHCDGTFCFEESGPVRNGFKYCPYCGRSLQEKKSEDE